MNLPFDIFEMAPGDRVVWRGTAGTIEEARAYVQKLAGDSPGRYLILRLQTGDGLVVDTDQAEQPTNACYPGAEPEEHGAN